MKSNNSKFCGIALLAGLMTLTAHGATLLSITNTNGRSPAFTGTIGASFKVGASDLLVTSLGFQDFNDNGLTQDHKVGIWTSASGLLEADALVTATVPIGGSALTVVSHFQYVTLASPVTLLAGQTYFIGAQTFATGTVDQWSDGDVDNVTPSSEIEAGLYDAKYSSSSFGKPTSDGAGNTPERWGPANMQFTVVPEPSAALLGGLGVLCLLRRRRN